MEKSVENRGTDSSEQPKQNSRNNHLENERN